MVTLVKHDLEFMLKQIIIAERHAAGEDLATIVGNPMLPYGLRTVDGTYNNIVAGREKYGSADQVMPRLLTTDFRDAEKSIFPGQNGSTSYKQKSGDVFDSAPRTISNLISDQTTDNPAIQSTDHVLIDHDNNPDTPDVAFIENKAPDDGISAPFNSWMTLFGQFFDHGLDLINKGGSGTVYMPLKPDDPLYVEGGHTNFMVLTRAQNQPGADGVLGTADDVQEHVNQTTGWVDQNQTYTSHPSHQVFLREYVLVEGKPVATGRLLDGEKGGPPTWAEVKKQARDVLGIELTDADVTNIPLLATDQYGKFEPGANGLPQIVTASGKVEGKLGAPISTTEAIRTKHAFLDDIAHTAGPVLVNGVLQKDADGITGNTDLPMDNRGRLTQYDNELLDAHFITGDGRGNENIGLTAVHHVFHSEHNRISEHLKDVILESGDLAFLKQWLNNPEAIAEFPANAEAINALQWNGERVFQAARFTTEMQYQHLVFEEFARKVQPDVDLFVFEPSVDINPSIVAEFAHVVYRFGHSMLTETVDRINIDGTREDVGLIEAFLNPVEFVPEGMDAREAAGAIVRGMTRQAGNEIDEFITPALRSNLLGLPLDLAAINIARARDTGVPSLNETRKQFFEMTGDTQLKPYGNWIEFAQNINHSGSVINFIAAYGRHETILNATTAEAKRDAAAALVLGGEDAPADRLAFLGGTGAWANTETGLNLIDLWIGGLAEKKMSFGGMLGSTFSFVFESQLENLQDGDRFYYLSRVQGLNLLNELENNSLAKIVMRNTDLGSAESSHLPGDIFSTPDHFLELDIKRQYEVDPERASGDPVRDALYPLVIRKDGYLQYTGAEHVVLGGTSGNDTLIAGDGDDTVWGDDGDDVIEGGYGVDILHGGNGNDIITNAGTDIGEVDMIHGEAGDDVMHGGSGLALLFGGAGTDFITTGPDGKEAFGGTGGDFILGGDGVDFLLGNEGDDWMEGGARFDTLAGDNSELFFNSTIIGHDVLNGGSNDTDYDGEAGDDIMVQGEGIQRNEGMAGFDWAIHKGHQVNANSDLMIKIFTTDEDDILRDRFDMVEGLSGWDHDDVLRGDDLDPENAEFDNALNAAGIARIDGLQEILGAGVTSFKDGNIILGGRGSDIIEGRGGNDIIDGDAWLNVRISVRDRNNPDREIDTADSMTALQTKLLDRTYLPSQLKIIREILVDTPEADEPQDVDTAVFAGLREEYLWDEQPDANGVTGIMRVIDDAGDGADENDTVIETDLLRNIERLQFADGVVRIAGENAIATGTVTISDLSPDEHQMLEASHANIVDEDGFDEAGIQYLWEAEVDGEEGLWQEVGTGKTFHPDDSVVGLRLRVTAVFEDGRGGVERIVSNVTAAVNNVNDDPTGTLQISDMTPEPGQKLIVSQEMVSDADGLKNAEFTFQWQHNDGSGFKNIVGATGAEFTATEALKGQQLRVVGTYTDDHNTQETVYSASTAAINTPAPAPAPGPGPAPAPAPAPSPAPAPAPAPAPTPAPTEPAPTPVPGAPVQGSDSADALIGTAASETFVPAGGNDIVDGGAGIDTVMLNAAGPGAVSMRIQNGNLVLTQVNGGTDGSDILANVEILQFAGTVDTGPAATLGRLYESILGRAPDAEGQAYWISVLESGTPITTVAHEILFSQESQQAHGALSNQQFVETLYQNVLGRAPDAEGLGWWTNALQNGNLDRAGLLLQFINSPENLAGEPTVPVELSISQTPVGALVRLYDTALLRNPDEGGINYWLSQTESGLSIGEVADHMLASPEAQALYGNMNHQQFVSSLYENALGRTASAEETAGWVNALNTGAMDRGDVLAGFANSQEKIELMGVLSTSIETI